MRRHRLLAAAALALLIAAAPARANTYTVVIDANATWTQAKAAAVLAGGYLATITSAAEQATVMAAIAAATPPRDGGFWINLRETSECCYVWDDGETTCYGNFFTSEPNNGFSGEDRGQILWSSDLSRRGRWNDVADAGLPGTGDVSRLGYVIETGPADPAGPCGTCVPVNPASSCNTPPSGATVTLTRISGHPTGPGTIGRTIIDIPSRPPARGWPRPTSVQATYTVTVPIPGAAPTGIPVAIALRDSINRQVGGAGFVASFAVLGDSTLIQMYRPTGPYTSSDVNTVPGITLSIPQPPITPASGSGPMLSPPAMIVLLLALAFLASVALRKRRRASS